MQNATPPGPEIFLLPDGSLMPISALMQRLRSMVAQRGIVLVGVDGCGGSGKSTLARALVTAGGGDVTMVQMDDFYKPVAERPRGEERPIGGNFDWEHTRPP